MKGEKYTAEQIVAKLREFEMVLAIGRDPVYHNTFLHCSWPC